MNIVKMYPTAIIEVEFTSTTGLMQVSLQPHGYGEGLVPCNFNQGEMPGKRFRLIIEALDVIDQLEK